jgi:hypothetical protein
MEADSQAWDLLDALISNTAALTATARANAKRKQDPQPLSRGSSTPQRSSLYLAPDFPEFQQATMVSKEQQQEP